jgi:hypothetical protein
MKRIIAATTVAALLTVTGVASAAKCPTRPSDKNAGGTSIGCKTNCN